MAPHELAEIIRKSTHSVFSTMLGTELAPLEALDDPKPFMASEVIGFIGMAGDFAGYVSIHLSKGQATDFTARLIGVDVDEHHVRPPTRLRRVPGPQPNAREVGTRVEAPHDRARPHQTGRDQVKLHKHLAAAR